MNRRFVLSVAGMAGAAVAAPSAAADITITMHLDYWEGEHGMSFSNGSSGVGSYVLDGVVTAFSSGSAMVVGSSLSSWTSGVSPYTSGYRFVIDASVGAGTYDVNLTDSYGDGWAWNDVSGADAFVVTATGDATVSGDTALSFAGGSSRTGSVVVTPAPGALALLGLAGISTRRRPRG